MIRKSLLIFGLLSLLLVSCSKEEGLGGKATIKGKLYIKQYVGGVLTSEYYAQNVNVYIIYGEGRTMYDDVVKTSYDGSFEFPYLRKGKYQVFAYTDDATVASGISEVIVDAEIASNKDVIDVGTITVKD